MDYQKKYLNVAPENSEYEKVNQKIRDLEASYLLKEELAEELQIERDIIPARKPEPPLKHV